MPAGGKRHQRFFRFSKRAHSVHYVRVLGLGWGGGDVNVHANLRHMHMLRHVRVLGLGWGGGDVNVHVNLRQMRMLRHVRGLGLGWVFHLAGNIILGYTHVFACFPISFYHEQAVLAFRLSTVSLMWSCILASQALNSVKQSPSKKTMLITDGAPCYPSLSFKFGWRHAWRHATTLKGPFVSKNELEIRRFKFTQVGSMECEAVKIGHSM